MIVSFRNRLRILFSNDFFVSAVFLIVYLFTNSYILGWDDQHLEIPLLKHLIDPALYKGDYYVESLAKNFSSYLYPILAKLITVPQIPAVYFMLFLISRYAMFFFIYKLWLYISKDRFAACAAVITFIVLGRTEEFLYRTFSHQEFCYIFLFSGLYLFYRERFLLAALLFGIGANFHAIYNLMGILYMLGFLLVFHPNRIRMFLTAGMTFALGCMPFLSWQIPRSINDKLVGTSVPVSEWMPLYFQSCPQNLLFNNTPWNEAIKNWPFMLSALEPYIFILVLYIFLLIVSPAFREDKKINVLVWVGFTLIIFSTIFSYVIPSRFVVDLNLMRNEQFIAFFLIAYTTFWAVKRVREGSNWQAFLAGLAFLIVGFVSRGNIDRGFHKYFPVMVIMSFIFIFLQMRFQVKWDAYLRRAFIIIPLGAALISFSLYHHTMLELRGKGTGFWQLQRNWEDIQQYVRNNTPKKAMILAPINMDMGGFRIHSDRKIVVCIRDCGIIGFDYSASIEWLRRMNDLKDFTVFTNGSVLKAVMIAIAKYKVDYIVFMRYYEPQADNSILRKLYQNEVFSLFKVVTIP